MLSMTSAGKELSLDSAVAGSGALSPDTTHLLIQTSDGKTLVITGSRYDGPLATLPGTDATASPDGLHVAYLRDGTLYVANIDGSGERAVANGRRAPVVGRRRPGLVAGRDAHRDLQRLRAPARERRRIRLGGPLERPEPERESLVVGETADNVAWETNADAHWEIWVSVDCNRLRPAHAALEPDGELSLPAVLAVRARTRSRSSATASTRKGAQRNFSSPSTRSNSSSRFCTSCRRRASRTRRRAGLRPRALIAVAAGQECRRWGIYITRPDVGSQSHRRSNICRFDGTPAADTIRGSQYFDLINGLGGNDVIDGSGGNDKISGNGGNDTIHGGAGNDFILAGPGNDRIFGGPGNDTIIGGNGIDRIDCGPGNDTVEAAGPLDIIARNCEHVRH